MHLLRQTIDMDRKSENVYLRNNPVDHLEQNISDFLEQGDDEASGHDFLALVEQDTSQGNTEDNREDDDLW